MNNKKKRIFDIIQIGYAGDVASRTFDIVITAAIIINLFIAIFDTFEQSIPYQPVRCYRVDYGYRLYNRIHTACMDGRISVS